jgi:8-amino-3,8-dideoxy-alpha-D-manno-octulosonate transaminase
MVIMDFPTVIEIEINSDCNLACSYCPNSKMKRKEQGEMKDEVLATILAQLKSIKYSGKIAFDFYNEPTIAKKFLEHVRLVKKELPQSFIEIYSNGTRVNTENDALEIIDAGVDKFIVTKHEAIEQFKFTDVYNSLGVKHKSFFELREHEDLSLTNRGGILEDIYNEGTINEPCRIPSLITTITLEGNVLPCFEDFNQTETMGNILEEHITEIWNKPKYKEFRRSLLQGKRFEHEICKNCNRISEAIMDKKKEKHLIGDEEIEAVTRVLRSGKLFRHESPSGECNTFERSFSKELGVENALLVNSGTNALVAALMTAGIGPGDEVIIPAYTFVATATAVINVGAIPIIVNIDEKLGMDVLEIESLITSKTKALIPVHMDGVSCDIEKIVFLGKQKELIVIEDACQAMGAKYNDKYLGTFGDFGCFSLNVDKVLTAGEGGIVVSKTKKHGEQLICISDAGFPFGEVQVGSLELISPFLGRSMRVSEITGALINQQFKKKDEILKQHRERKKILISILAKNTRFKILEIINPNEDCGTKLHLSFSNPLHSQMYGKQLRDGKVLVYPPFVRRAHLAWQWMDILGDKSEINNERNPYKLTENKYLYKKSDFAKSVSIIMNILILDIDINWTLEETENLAEKINFITKGV